ncbi:hypothetical protein [uncultured Boseongicola sp.]|jgi:hypothetical protein|uniref:hypothetical protein n=1 Tax=uncultured Boseongicola sp. TaxID=1648499 RepID=UPI0026065EEB|nr:hypothetical protein [uncultured Boseongicola sp.]
MMPKMALLVLIFAVVAGVISVVFKGVAVLKEPHDERLGDRGGSMKRLAFFLLLALIAYVAAFGAS